MAPHLRNNLLPSNVDTETPQVLLERKDLSTMEGYLRKVRFDEFEAKVESSRLAAYL